MQTQDRTLHMSELGSDTREAAAERQDESCSWRRLSKHILQMDGEEATDRPNLYCIHGSERAVVIDAGASAAQARTFIALVRDQTGFEPSCVLLTHWHWDHSFGAVAYDCPVAAHPVSIGYLSALKCLGWTDDDIDARVERGTENAYVASTLKLEIPDANDRSIRVPDRAVADGETIDLGGVSVEARYLTCDHADDAVGYLVAADGVLLMGDVLYDDYYHGLDHFSERRLRALRSDLSSIDANILCDSHVSHPFAKDAILQLVDGLIETGICVRDGSSLPKFVLRDGE